MFHVFGCSIVNMKLLYSNYTTEFWKKYQVNPIVLQTYSMQQDIPETQNISNSFPTTYQASTLAFRFLLKTGFHTKYAHKIATIKMERKKCDTKICNLLSSWDNSPLNFLSPSSAAKDFPPLSTHKLHTYYACNYAHKL